MELEILSEQFGQFVNGQLVTYQDRTQGCQAAVVRTPATATTSVMDPGATTPQHYSSRERGGGCVTDSCLNVVTVSVDDNVLMWRYDDVGKMQLMQHL